LEEGLIVETYSKRLAWRAGYAQSIPGRLLYHAKQIWRVYRVTYSPLGGEHRWVLLLQPPQRASINDATPDEWDAVSRDFFANAWKSCWIVWDGGAMPVDSHTIVDVRHRDGSIHRHQLAGELWGAARNWEHTNAPNDIVGYNIIS
jgi:hypothetical protein